LQNVFGVEQSLWKRSSQEIEYVPSEDPRNGDNSHGGLIQGLKKEGKGEGGNLECLGHKWKHHKKAYKVSEESQGRDVREAFVEFLEFIEGTKADDLDSYFHKWFGNRNEAQLIQEWEGRFDVTVFLKK
jgi:hypothetical protein